MTTQWWRGVHNTISNSAANFGHPVGGILAANATENQVAAVSAAGTLKRMKVWLTAAPGGSASYRFQVSINGTPSTTLDLTITGAAVSGSVTANVSVSAGDRVAIKFTPTSTPTAPTAEVELEFDPTTTNYFCYPAVARSFSLTTTPVFVPALYRQNQATSGSLGVNKSISPLAGTIRQIYVNCSVAPSGNSITFDVRVNGSTQQTVTITTGNTASSATGLSIAVAAGDQLDVVITRTTGTASTTPSWCLVIEPSSTTALWCWGGETNVLGASSVNYLGYNSAPAAASGESTTETDVQAHAPDTLTITALYMELTFAPGATKSRAIVSRLNTSNGAMGFTFGTADTALHDSTNRDNLSSGDLINLRHTPTNTPASADGDWAIAFGISAATATGAASFPHLTAQGTGSEAFIATGAAAFPHVTAQGTGAESPRGIGAATFSHLGAQGSGAHTPPTANGAVALPHFMALGAGAALPRGIGIVAFPPFLASSPDARAHGGHVGGQHFIAHSRDIVFPHLTLQGTGALTLTNAGLVTFPVFRAQGSGIRNTNGLGVVAFPAFLTTGGQGNQNPAGIGAIAFPHFTAQGGTAIGIGIIAFPSFDAQGYSESPIGVGIGAITFPAFLVQGRQVFVSPVIILTPRGPKLATAFIHSPWYPRHRLATLSTWSNGDRSFTAVSRLGSKDTGQGAGHISNRDPSLLRDSGILTHGNLLVITSPVAQPWVGVLVTTNEDDSTGQIELSAISYEAVLDGRITPQGQKYTASIGANAVFDSLIAEANARNHTGLMQPTIVEMSNPVEDLEIGGQSVLEALNELCGRTDSEWWLDYQVTPQYINATVRLGFMQGLDLSATRHYYQGTHFTSQFKQDMSQVKQSVTAVGDFGADLPDRNSITMVGSEGPQHLGIQTAAIHQAGVTTARRLAALPAGLRNEKIVFEVPTGNTSELSRRAGLVQERPLQAERSFQVTFNNLVDFRDVQAGNIVTLWGKWGGVNGQHVVRVMGSQPDEERGEAICAVWELVQ